MKESWKKLMAFFSEGHERSIRAKKNIIASFIIKGLNIAIGLVLVPLTINYLNPTKYGIWVTLSSIIGWFGFFDIGMGHGLRNRFAEALATGQHQLARIYVSTTYAILSLIIGGALVLFCAINPFLNWSAILNAGNDASFERELSLLAVIVFTFFCLSFVFKLITTVLTADQQPAKASVFDLLGKIFTLLIVYIMIRTTSGSLLYLGIVMSAIPVLILVISSIWFYNGKYKPYRPSYKYVEFSRAHDLLTLGAKFFIIQIASVVLYQTNTIIISHLFGPAEVTPYNVAFKYFSVLMMGFSIIITPFWSAFTEAWSKKEIDWIRKTMQKLIGLWVLLLLSGIVMLVCSKWIYKAWVGDTVVIPFTMSVLVAAWVLLNAWNGIYSHFLNGLSKIKLQIYIGIATAIVNIPLAIFMGHRWGIEGLLLANVLLGIVESWIFPVQYAKLINNKAKGIWNQ
jgi:O-antigen/teichoic acid export membrane protein